MPAKESRAGRQYERLVAAIFRSDGQLIERNRKTPGRRIAEVDVLAWRPEHDRLVCTLVECKCEQRPPKPNDLLLLRGRQALVDADRAVLVTAKPFSQPAEPHEVARRLGITLAHGRAGHYVHSQLHQAGLVSGSWRGDLVRHWRCVFEVEDACRTILHREARRARDAGNEQAAVAQAYSYLWGLESLWWNRADLWARAVDSYTLHRRWKLVAQDVAAEYEAAGGGHSPRRHLNAAFAEGWCPPARAALYVQSRARLTLAVLAAQCALDLRQNRVRRDAFFGQKLQFSARGIPQELQQSFRAFVETLYRRPAATLLFPALLQTWQAGWGGFLVVTKRRSDEEAIAGEVSAPRRYFLYALDQLDRLLTVVNVLVGSRRGWFAEIPTRREHEEWRVHTLKLLPEAWKGLGLARRRLLDAGSQPVRPWPDYYERWERQVLAYQTYLSKWERGESPSWTSIEHEVYGRVQATVPSFT